MKVSGGDRRQPADGGQADNVLVEGAGDAFSRMLQCKRP